jgi:cysteine desulfurase
VATLLAGRAEEIVFAASGTEVNNAVIAGLAQQCGHRGHLITTTLEHPSVRAAARRAGEMGMQVTEVPPGQDGIVPVSAIEAALRPDTRLVCLMLANNELGTLQPVPQVAALCRRRGVPVLSDVVQGVGKIPVRADALGVDYMTLGGHKFHAPPGAAALWIRPGAHFPPLLVGAPQEAGRRAGTENVPAIVGLGWAAEFAHDELAERHAHLLALRQQLEKGLERIEDCVVHCQESERLPHTTNVAFLGLLAHRLMERLDKAGFAVSTGAACTTGQPQASAVLRALGLPQAEALATLRISFGMTNTAEEVAAFLPVLGREVEALRQEAAGKP